MEEILSIEPMAQLLLVAKSVDNLFIGSRNLVKAWHDWRIIRVTDSGGSDRKGSFDASAMC